MLVAHVIFPSLVRLGLALGLGLFVESRKVTIVRVASRLLVGVLGVEARLEGIRGLVGVFPVGVAISFGVEAVSVLGVIKPVLFFLTFPCEVLLIVLFPLPYQNKYFFRIPQRIVGLVYFLKRLSHVC